MAKIGAALGSTLGGLIVSMGILSTGAHAQQATSAPIAVKYLDQGWTTSQRDQWYTTSQGSQLIPYAWFLALEQPDGTGKFRDEGYFFRFQYLPNEVSPSNPDGLPVGFAVDRPTKARQWLPQPVSDIGVSLGILKKPEPWLGLTCAACHTVEMQVGDTTIRVDGAATLADFQSFLEELTRALEQTDADNDKFARFATSVLGPSSSASASADLRNELKVQIQRRRAMAEKNATPVRYGYGRLDAVGHILNQIAADVKGNTPAVPSDAPVSYPFIWNAPQHDKVQWDGIAANGPKITDARGEFDLGALVRNVSEVLGVFAQVDVKAPYLGLIDRGAYASTVRSSNLIELERLLTKLQSPRWPAELAGPIDEAQKSAGKDLYDKHCKECHAVLAPSDTSSPIRAVMTPICETATQTGVGTDIWMAFNAVAFEADSGNMKGAIDLLARPDPEIHKIGNPESGSTLLANTTVRVIVGELGSLADQFLKEVGFGRVQVNSIPKLLTLPLASGAPSEGSTSGVTRSREQICASPLKDHDLMKYKGRPLNGIWATAPYLHNGSVPDLYSLLLPAEERPKSFYVGNRKFEPKKVGFVSDDPTVGFRFQVIDDTGAPIKGNSNAGHEYGTQGPDKLSPDQRLQLLEYLKSL